MGDGPNDPLNHEAWGCPDDGETYVANTGIDYAVQTLNLVLNLVLNLRKSCAIEDKNRLD